MSRTVIDLDDKLVKRAKELTGVKKKVDLVNQALEELVNTPNLRRHLQLLGKIPVSKAERQRQERQMQKRIRRWRRME